MKDKIHPKYEETTVSCACGWEFKTRSTAENIRITICSHCHPFITGGDQRFVDTAGRIEKFQSRYQGAAAETSSKKKSEKKLRAGTVALKSAKAMKKRTRLVVEEEPEDGKKAKAEKADNTAPETSSEA